MTKEKGTVYALKALIIGPFTWLALAHPVASLWILTVITVAWVCFPALEWVDRVVPGPRLLSHGMLYLLYAGYVYLIYRYLSPWIFTSVSQMAEAGKELPELIKHLPGFWSEFRQILEGHVSGATIDKAIELAQGALAKHSTEAGLVVYAAGKNIAFGITVVLGIIIILPLTILMLHTAREEEEAGARAVIERVFDGTDGVLTKMMIDMWTQYVRLSRSIFRAILTAMMLYSVVYAFVLLLFRLGFGGNIKNAAHAGYSILLGVLGGIPLFGGMINWGTISYVGYTTYGLTVPFAVLFVTQMIVHKTETGFVTPKLMGTYMHVPILGLILSYAIALSIFGANVTGFVASFLLPPSALAIFHCYDKFTKGEYGR
jgi:hypothetical protein